MKLTAYELGKRPEPSEIVSQSRNVKRVKCAYAFVRPHGGQVVPDSPAQKCRRAGLNRDAVSGYRRRNPGTPLTVDEIIEHLLSRKEGVTLFTDANAALEEAEYLADKTGKPHAIVRDSEQPEGMRVISHKRDDGREIVKVCAPSMEDAA